jgi:hypothetical protein
MVDSFDTDVYIIGDLAARHIGGLTVCVYDKSRISSDFVSCLVQTYRQVSFSRDRDD